MLFFNLFRNTESDWIEIKKKFDHDSESHFRKIVNIRDRADKVFIPMEMAEFKRQYAISSNLQSKYPLKPILKPSNFIDYLLNIIKFKSYNYWSFKSQFQYGLIKKLTLLIGLIVFVLLSLGIYDAYTGDYKAYKNIKVGAKCKDGWISNSIGRGTCSHHGGIDYYIKTKVFQRMHIDRHLFYFRIVTVYFSFIIIISFIDRGCRFIFIWQWLLILKSLVSPFKIICSFSFKDLKSTILEYEQYLSNHNRLK